MTTPLADAVRLRLPIPIVEQTASRTSWRDLRRILAEVDIDEAALRVRLGNL